MVPGAYCDHSRTATNTMTSDAASPATRRKRKAESQDNERLNKRLSLLNLEHNGQKLYVPVENPTPSSSTAAPPSSIQPPPPIDTDDSMHVDDTKHKVYIYSIDDELSSSDSELDDGRLVFLPDIERHLRKHRLHLSAASPSVPRPVPVNPEGELAGMQVVLYNEPSSISVPAEQDSVRKAIIDARARTRDRQRREREGTGDKVEMPPRIDPSILAAASGASAGAGEQQEEAMDLD